MYQKLKTIPKQNYSNFQKQQSIYFQLNIEYVFEVTGTGDKSSYWTLIGAEIDNRTLALAGDQPAAPTMYSYKCSRTLRFGKDDYYLEFANIQVYHKICTSQTHLV